MKKQYYFLFILFLLVGLVSCKKGNNDKTTDDTPTSFEDAFIISNIQDNFANEETTKTYKLYADHEDTYELSVNSSLKLTLKNDKDNLIAEGEGQISANLKRNQLVYLTVERPNFDIRTIMVKAKYVNNPIKLPYPTNFKEQDIDTSYSDEAGILNRAQVNYIKRTGGTYIYSNNPEMFTDADLNKCLMRNNGLSGEVYMTFEHANYSSTNNAYLGYKLVNNTDKDVYVTVENIGFQAGGTWFGQLAWYDFYNTSFQLPEGYLVNGSIASQYAGYDYAYQDYKPRVYTPTTYKLPANESFFVIGGSSLVNYNNINVDNTANRPLGRIKCSNGNVKFKVTNGNVDGLMFIYTSPSLINDNMEEVGYVTSRDGRQYGQQYSGYANHHGVIDNDMMWTFNDKIRSQKLPVTYTNQIAESTSGFKPYQAYKVNNREHNTTAWMTHLNPQNNAQAVGMDMVDFICRTTDKKTVVIDNNHADGAGEPANTANWMIEYQDNFTFVNKGNKERTIILRIKDNGTLATLLRDKEGNVLQTYYSIGLAIKSFKEYRLTIRPQSSIQVCLDYLLVACSYGSVTHEVSLV